MLFFAEKLLSDTKNVSVQVFRSFLLRFHGLLQSQILRCSFIVTLTDSEKLKRTFTFKQGVRSIVSWSTAPNFW